MCHWRKWIWPGILATLILSLLGLWFKSDLIENQLKGNATAALTEQGLGWANVELDGRDAVVTGMAPTEADLSKASEIAQNAYEVRVVDNKATLIPEQKPYKLSATRAADGSITLEGFVPNDKVRGEVVAEASKLGTVTDKMTLARGAPAALTAIAGFGLAQLSQLKEGKVDIDDTAISATGVADDFSKFDSVTSALSGTLPDTASLAMQKITPPTVSPYTWSADYDGGKVVLGGHVPDADARAAAVAAAGAALSGKDVVDQMKIATGAPQGFGDASGFGLNQLPRFDSGRVALSDLDLTVEGKASSVSSYTDAKSAIGGALPADMKLASENITPPTVSPYTWSADYDGNKVVLDGYVPDEAARSANVAAAKSTLPNAEVVDNQVLATGAPTGFIAAAGFGLNQLPRFDSGRVALSDLDLTVEGKANSVANYSGVRTVIGGSLPGGMKLASENITPPTVSPYTWGADYDGNKVVLDGFVPDEAARAANIAAAEAALPNAEIVDNQAIALGAPAGFVAAAGFGLNQLPRFNNGMASLSDLDLSVSGVAKTVGDFDAAKASIAGDLPAGVKIAMEEIAPASVSPYVWNADFDGSQVILGGFVPSSAARAEIIGEVKSRMRGRAIIDNMKLAGGAPDTFADSAKFGIEQLPRFTEGAVSIRDNDFTVRGVAKSIDNYEAAHNAADKLPNGLNLASKDITPATVSPYLWAADYDGKTVHLTGFVPSEASRKASVAAAGKALPDVKVTENLQIAAGAPKDFDAANAFASAQLTRFTEGVTELRDLNLSVRGKAKTTGEYDAGKAAVAAALPAGMKLAAEQIRPPSADGDYVWSAALNGDTVTLEGFAPSEGDRESLAKKAAAIHPNAKIVNNMKVVTGAPDGFISKATFGMQQLNRFTEGFASLNNKSLSVEGTAKTIDDYADATKELNKGLDDGYTYGSRVVRLATVSPYRLAVGKVGDTITAQGNVPDVETRASLIKTLEAANPSSKVIDRTVLAAGVPDGVNWSQAINFGAERLGSFKKGSYGLVDDAFTIEGEATTAESYTDATGAIKSGLAGGVKLASEKITAPVASPYEWSIIRGEQTVLIDGYIPDRGQGDVHVKSAKDKFGSSDVRDSQSIAAGAPRNYDGATSVAIQSISRLQKSRADLVDTKLTVRGEALSDQAAEEIRRRVENGLPPGYRGEAILTVRKVAPVERVAPNECQFILSSALKENQIKFEVDKSIIRQDSYGLLDELLFVAQRCPDAKIEIEGHTDSDASDEYNQRLSEARANAVLEYLVRGGVVNNRLTSIGYGESKPIASNATKEGKAQNRRIEFRVINN